MWAIPKASQKPSAGSRRAETPRAAAPHGACAKSPEKLEDMDPALIPYAERTAPRYTSYPAAPHFSDAVDAGIVAGWLAELSRSAKLGLYLHVPYCREICWYCGCHTFAARKDAPILEYAEALRSEIDLVANYTVARRVTEIAWGGGTPNILPPIWFQALLDRLAARFDLSAVEEHAVECDPRILTQAHVDVFRKCGVTRASLGVQDFNPEVQAAIGREQPEEQVAAAARMLRAAGLKLNFDLMYGLPGQSLRDAVRSARIAAKHAPDRLAVFGYAHVPWFKGRQRLIAEERLPDAIARYDQSEAVRETLLQEGYVAIGFDHYARPDDPLAEAAAAGKLKRSFQGYARTGADALIGLGASAISTYPQGYAQNAPEPAQWRRCVTQGLFAAKRGAALTPDDRRRRAIIEQILCGFSVDLRAYGGMVRYGPELEQLRLLAADGLVEIENERVIVTERGRPFARLAAQAFDAYRTENARHSKAV